MWLTGVKHCLVSSRTRKLFLCQLNFATNNSRVSFLSLILTAYLSSTIIARVGTSNDLVSTLTGRRHALMSFIMVSIIIMWFTVFSCTPNVRPNYAFVCPSVGPVLFCSSGQKVEQKFKFVVKVFYDVHILVKTMVHWATETVKYLDNVYLVIAI